jgi:hypothetical protein
LETTCPSCGAAMTGMPLAGRLGAHITIDACTECQVFWFDTHENLQLAPGSTLKLFKLIGDHSARKPPLSPVLKCPRCRVHLLNTHDRQRNTPFEYWRCKLEHGRLETFFNFLREKDFIRPLSPQQIEELRQNVQTVNCSNCGAPVDLAVRSACTHCGSALSMLDMKQAERLIAELRSADTPRPVDPDLPLKLARVRNDVDGLFPRPGTAWWVDVSSAGLVEAGLNVVMEWLIGL